MKTRLQPKEQYGFTMIELMIAMLILGILATVAFHRYMNYQCKAKQVEAKLSLGSIAKFQQAYHAVFDTYGISTNAIGYSAKGVSRYAYTISEADATTFTAAASSVQPGIAREGAGDDEWTIDQSLILLHSKNPCTD